jgi:uracil-DNA glycosylase
MNLFANETANLLLDLGFEGEWADQISSVVGSEMLVSILTKIKAQRQVNTIYPDEQDVFKVFKIIPFNCVQVVIIGQDPYFNGNADGLAFSCKREVSPSLRQILIAICNDLKSNDPLRRSEHMNLYYLARQGVFPYNPALTVVKDNPASHVHIWSEFSTLVLRRLLNKKKLVWMAWGNVAQNALPFNIPDSHLVLKATHPVSASYNNDIWKCDHFSKANEYLKTNNMEEIKWL